MTVPADIVLVHGSWHRGAVSDAVAMELRERGYRLLTPEDLVIDILNRVAQGQAAS